MTIRLMTPLSPCNLHAPIGVYIPAIYQDLNKGSFRGVLSDMDMRNDLLWDYMQLAYMKQHTFGVYSSTITVGYKYCSLTTIDHVKLMS